jgi:hypothetical protein
MINAILIRKNNKRNVSTNMPLQQLPNSALNYLLLNENSFKPNCKFPCVKLLDHIFDTNIEIHLTLYFWMDNIQADG